MARTITVSFQDGQDVISQVVSTTPDSVADAGRADALVTIPASTNNYELVIAFPYATISSVYILSDKALTVKTNSSGSPDDTIAIAAAKPLAYYGSGTNPFTANVTKLYITNAGGTAADFKIRVGYDGTPA